MPSLEYCEKFYNRTADLINQFHPDLLYFDDTFLPLFPVSDAGLKIAAHFYNSNMARHKGRLEAVLLGKVLTEDKKRPGLGCRKGRARSNTNQSLANLYLHRGMAL